VGACAAAALAITGCGSSSHSDKQLRAQATSICAHANRVIGRITTPSAASGGGAFLQQGIASLKPELRQLRQMTAPQDSADVWSTAIRSLSDELAALESTAAKINAGADPVSAFRSLQRTVAPLERQADSAWQALQIPACQNQ
jgi:hypothetical protein